MQSFKRKLMFRTSASLTLAVTLAVLGSSIVHYQRTKSAIKSKLISIASASAGLIDVEEHEKLKTKQDVSSEYYKKTISRLNNILRNDPTIRYIYTIRPIEDPPGSSGSSGSTGYEFVLDGASAEHPPGPSNADYSKLGDRYDRLSLAALIALRTGEAVAEDKERYDAWGWSLSAQELCNEILAEVVKCTPEHKVDDDTSILVLKFLNPINKTVNENLDQVA